MLNTLEPKALWENFSALNAIPRPSKKEERVIEFMLQFGKQLNLPTRRDEVGNVIITKPAAKGMELRATVCLQSHLDMVHQKNAGTNFDFEKEGINMFVDGDWVRAKGTTLGADNGIGVAAIMALLASHNIPHPPLEALFTIDEETGMTGALALKEGLLNATYMLNLDTEDDNELTIGCAGGVDVTANGTYETASVPGGYKFFTITVNGLTGGHSGMDIHKGRGNANKLMNRVLIQATDNYELRIVSLDGGSLRNAIPRESVAVIGVPEKFTQQLNTFITEQNKIIKAEHSFTDPELKILIEPCNAAAQLLNTDFQYRLLRCLRSCPVGIYRMSPDIPGLVQSSNNMARVLVKDGAYLIQCLTRSSVDSEKTDLAETLRSCFELCGATVSFSGAYPGWTPRPSSKIVSLMSDIYKTMFGESAHVNAVHAGLECGILGTNYPDMQMISFGPNIRGAHSPDECVQISSVQKFWAYFLRVLQEVPVRG